VRYCGDTEELLNRIGSSYEQFIRDKIYYTAGSMYVLQIAELTGHLSQNFRDSHPEQPWSNIRSMRNMFAHEYWNMNAEKIWNTLCDELPKLGNMCAAELQKLQASKEYIDYVASLGIEDEDAQEDEYDLEP
jgi:uncharacterized protein with HEPN domain